MKLEKGLVIRKICIIAGIVLLLGASITLFFWRWNISTAIKQAENYTSALQARIPEPQDAALEERRDNTMSVLSIDGTDFVGIIELPRYQSVLPVGAAWGKTNRYPCRFSGNIYDGTMQIGATTQTGQYDFYRALSVGDAVIYTDMEGNRYTFEITNLRYKKHADQAALQQDDAALTLFVKNIYAFEYLIISCNVPH